MIDVCKSAKFGPQLDIIICILKVTFTHTLLQRPVSRKKLLYASGMIFFKYYNVNEKRLTTQPEQETKSHFPLLSPSRFSPTSSSPLITTHIRLGKQKKQHGTTNSVMLDNWHPNKWSQVLNAIIALALVVYVHLADQGIETRLGFTKSLICR